MLNLNPVTAARYAELLMCTWDMCNVDLGCCDPATDIRIQTMGWQVVGYILGADNIIKTTIDQQKVRLAKDESGNMVCYGYLAHNAAGQYVTVIRGTDGAEEWADDFDFLQKTPNQPLQGKVDSGFYDIFNSMVYQPIAAGSSPTRLAKGIATALDGADVVILGHSLGSALAAYTSAELASEYAVSKISAVLFACPKPGNSDFASYYNKLGFGYVVYNYEADIVPKMPPFGYSALTNVILLQQGGEGGQVHISARKACCHHLISYIALLNIDIFKQTMALAGTTAGDQQCAACVTLQSNVSQPSLAMTD